MKADFKRDRRLKFRLNETFLYLSRQKVLQVEKLFKIIFLDEVQDKLIRKMGTPERDVFEYELQMDFIGKAIKETRKERHLTQEELGKLIGVQKVQISRLESNASNTTMDTLLRVFTALKAKVKLQFELPNLNISIGA
jgi:HTH-type transcriptional regulator/antitoxin HipB